LFRTSAISRSRYLDVDLGAGQHLDVVADRRLEAGDLVTRPVDVELGRDAALDDVAAPVEGRPDVAGGQGAERQVQSTGAQSRGHHPLLDH